jgi:hypothetical protein
MVPELERPGVRAGHVVQRHRCDQQRVVPRDHAHTFRSAKGAICSQIFLLYAGTLLSGGNLGQDRFLRNRKEHVREERLLGRGGQKYG